MHYFELKMARQFTDESILELEAATVHHQVSQQSSPPAPFPSVTHRFPHHPCSQLKFNEVPQYKGLFVYKHHAALHSARNIKFCGPPVVRLERMFENKLQYVKRRAHASNFRNPIFSVSL